MDIKYVQTAKFSPVNKAKKVYKFKLTAFTDLIKHNKKLIQFNII